MRFHLVDRVDAYEPARSIRARKLTSSAEEFWDVSDGGPTMPVPLVLESLCQAGDWLVVLSTDGRKRAALVSVGAASFLAPVRPGDVLELEGTVDSMSDEVAVMSGRVMVSGRPVLEARELMCVLVEAADLEDPAETARCRHLLNRSQSVE
jgi:3-hydroxyacyl-[acyl-carrier-protein] dehydratase